MRTCCTRWSRFAGLGLSALPDETTILNFPHLLERHGLGEALRSAINASLSSRGLTLREGTVMDASLVEAPSSTKNRSGKRDPEMRQAKKGNQWHFGMKMHVRADAETGGVAQLCGDVGERVGRGARAPSSARRRAARLGRRGLPQGGEGEARGEPGSGRGLAGGDATGPAWQLQAGGEASVRANAEHPFFYVKRMFGYGKVRYRGLHKNAQRIALLLLLLGFANLLIAERRPCLRLPMSPGTTPLADFGAHCWSATTAA